jgi:hypothetical protein
MSGRQSPSSPTPCRDDNVVVLTRTIRGACRNLLAAVLCLSGLAAISCEDGRDERSCRGDVGRDCPVTYDEALVGNWTCESFESISAGPCMTGGPLTLNRNWGTHQSNCFYDPTTRLLVGANRVNDTATYCDNTSASISTGDVPVPYPHYCILSSSDRSMRCDDSQP